MSARNVRDVVVGVSDLAVGFEGSHFSSADLHRHLNAYGRDQLTIMVREGQSTWNPASTKHYLWGPCTVRYVRHRDGGIDAWHQLV